MRLIDADKLIVHLELCKEYARGIGMPNATYSAFDAVIMDIEEMPTAEKRGRWEYNDYGGFGNWHCTACGEICICSNGGENYCPNCGAEMRKGNE